MSYSDSLGMALSSLHKTSSLIYSSAESAFYAEEYTFNGELLLLVKNDLTGNIPGDVKKYFFKNDSLVLVTKTTKNLKDGVQVFSDHRIFIRKNTLFKEESRMAASASSLDNLPYKEIKNAEGSSTGFTDSIVVLKDALRGGRQFDLTFDEFIPEGSGGSIILKNKIPGVYTSNITVTQRDSFIDSLIIVPQLFKNEKLKLNWILKNGEAFYVPVSVTSAKGLKR
ncbi:MAG: hypothetical protein V4687_08625 [Bacteroidota bacterium]